MTVLQTTKFPGKVVGRFLHVLAVSMNWWEVRPADRLWWSLKVQ
jgi:hypothetical protein